MKRNTGITRKNPIVFIAVTLSLLTVAPLALADWLDVIAENITVTNVRTGQSGTTVTAQAGDSLQIVCAEWVGLAAGHDVWETKTVQRWENRVMVDGNSVAIFNPTIAPGTMIGHKEGSSGIGGIGGYMSQNGLADIRNVYPPVSWIATGAGNHEARCVLNQPKQISDHVPTNNVATALIVVAATPQKPQANPPVSLLPATATGTLKRPEPTNTQRSGRTSPAANGSGAGTATAAATGLRAINARGAERDNAAVHVIEAESLIATASVSGGQMVRQEMAGFGAGWGGNAQLFWRPPAPAGSKPRLLTEFALPGAGTYDLVLYYTTAPDFGQFTVYIDGTNSTKHDGYGSQVGLRQALLGRYQLASGRHELAFEVTGKNQQSTNYVVGVDRLQLTSVP
jgi:hypothetical protein